MRSGDFRVGEDIIQRVGIAMVRVGVRFDGKGVAIPGSLLAPNASVLAALHTSLIRRADL